MLNVKKPVPIKPCGAICKYRLAVTEAHVSRILRIAIGSSTVIAQTENKIPSQYSILSSYVIHKAQSSPASEGKTTLTNRESIACQSENG